MINGNEYAWEDIDIVVEGKAVPLQGVTGIKYTSTKEHTNIHGRGSEPVAMGRGKADYSGELTILQSELEAMQEALPGNVPLTQRAPFNITVTYAPADGQTKTDQLIGCRITEQDKGITNDETHMVATLPLTILRVEYNKQ